MSIAFGFTASYSSLCVHRVILLGRPAQYALLSREVERLFGQNLLMECAISNGEVSTANLLVVHMKCFHV